MLLGRGMRQRRGLGGGKTVSLDRVTLTSRRLGLTGRPDRLIKTDGTIIPEEWKSSRSVWPNHKAQLGCYFLLIEENLRIRPTHDFIVLGDGTRNRIDNAGAAELGAGDCRAGSGGEGCGDAADPGGPDAGPVPGLWPAGELRTGEAC